MAFLVYLCGGSVIFELYLFPVEVWMAPATRNWPALSADNAMAGDAEAQLQQHGCIGCYICIINPHHAAQPPALPITGL